MNTTPDSAPRVSDFPACKVIYCILPDDGTDKRLLVELRKRHGVLRAGSATRRGVGALADARTKRGKLPEPQMVRLLFATCSEDQVDEIFDFIFWSAHIDKPGRGAIWQQTVTGGTPYELPADVPDEGTIS